MQNQSITIAQVLTAIFQRIFGSGDKNKFADEAKYSNGTNTEVILTTTIGEQDVFCDEVGVLYGVEVEENSVESQMFYEDGHQKKVTRTHNLKTQSPLNTVIWNTKIETFNFCTFSKVPNPPTTEPCPGSTGGSGGTTPGTSTFGSGGDTLPMECMQEVCREMN